MASWASRSAGASRAWLWNGVNDLGAIYSATRSYGNWGCFGNGGNGDGPQLPFLESAIRTGWGVHSLGFKIPAGSNDLNMCGAFYLDSSPDLQTRVGVGSRFVVTVSTYWDQAMCDLVAAHTGTKLFDIALQDTDYSPNGFVGTSVPGKLVVQSLRFSTFPHLYRYWNGSTNALLESGTVYENAPAIAPTCHYPDPYFGYAATLGGGGDDTAARVAAAANAPNTAGCFWITPGWYTWNLDVYLGDEVAPFVVGPQVATSYLNSTVKLYGQKDGESRVLLVDWNPNTPGYIPLEAAGTYGKVWLFPYFTDGMRAEPFTSSPGYAPADAHIYYDGLIIGSTLPGEADFIGSPGGGGVSPTGGVSPDVVGSSTLFTRSRINIG